MTFPLMVRAIRLSLETIDPGLEDAARALGAGPVDRFCTITLPLMAPGIVAGAIIAFAAGLGEFGAVITFASNIPGETRTLPLALYTALQSPGGDALAARLAGLSFLLGLSGWCSPSGYRARCGAASGVDACSKSTSACAAATSISSHIRGAATPASRPSSAVPAAARPR